MQRITIILNILTNTVLNFLSKKESIYYVTENADWVIKEIGLSLQKYIPNFLITTTYRGIRNSIVHFSSFNVFISNNGIKLPHKSNKIIVTIFHIVDGDKRNNFIASADKYVSFWQTSCNITKNKLIELGASAEKIILIPIGIELKYFSTLDYDKKMEKRKHFEIPSESIVIGSFQKDGNGWEEGLEPKLIKGPDVFCDAIEKLAKEQSIFVFLTGPARGYVKQRLKTAGIPFYHEFLKDPNDVAQYFQLCDLYIIASREEGGPRALLESMASGVPLISTKVGMAPDVIQNGINGFLVDIDDVEMICSQAHYIINNNAIREKIINNALETIKTFDYKLLANLYSAHLYKECR